MAAGQPYGQVRLGAAGGGGKGLQCWAPPQHLWDSLLVPERGHSKPPLCPLPSLLALLLLGSSRAVMWVLPRPGGLLPTAPLGLWIQQQGGIASPGS